MADTLDTIRSNYVKQTEQARGLVSNSVNKTSAPSNNQSTSNLVANLQGIQSTINQLKIYNSNRKLFSQIPGTTDWRSTWDPSKVSPDFGTSRFDKSINAYSDIYNPSDTRAAMQGFFGELGATVGAIASTTASTYANTMAIIPGAIMNGIDWATHPNKYSNLQGGDKALSIFNDFTVNNPLSGFIQNLNDAATQQFFTLYKTSEEQDMPWYQQLVHHPWTLFAGDVLPSIGFSFGSMIAGKSTAKMLSRIGDKAPRFMSTKKQINKILADEGIILSGATKDELNTLIKNTIKDSKKATELNSKLAKKIRNRNRFHTAVGLMTAAYGEAQFEGYSAAQELFDEQTDALDRAWNTPEFQDRLRAEYAERYKNVPELNRPTFTEFTSQKRSEFHDEILAASKKAGLLTTATQSILLSATNAASWKTFFHPYVNPLQETEESLRNLFVHTTKQDPNTLKNVINSLGVKKFTAKEKAGIIAEKAIMEGPVEEMGQALLSEMSKAKEGSGMFRDYKYLVDSEYSKEVLGLLDAALVGLNKSYLDADRWSEGFAGSIFGLLGLPDVGIRNKNARAKNKKGNPKLFGKNGAIDWNGWHWVGTEIKQRQKLYDQAQAIADRFNTSYEGMSTANIFNKVYENMTRSEQGESADGKKVEAITDAEQNFLLQGSNPLDLLRNVIMIHALSKKLDSESSVSAESRESTMLSMLQPIFDIYKSIGSEDLLNDFLDSLIEANVDFDDDTNEMTKFFNGIFEDDTFTKIVNPETKQAIVKSLSKEDKNKLLKSVSENAKEIKQFFETYNTARETLREVLLYKFPNMSDPSFTASMGAGFLARAERLKSKVGKHYFDMVRKMEGDSTYSPMFSKTEKAYKKFYKAMLDKADDETVGDLYFDYLTMADRLYDKLKADTEFTEEFELEDPATDFIRNMIMNIQAESNKIELMAKFNSDKEDDIYSIFYEIEEEIVTKQNQKTVNEYLQHMEKYLQEHEEDGTTLYDKVNYLLPLIDNIWELKGKNYITKLRSDLLSNGKLKNPKTFPMFTALNDFVKFLNSKMSFRRAVKSLSAAESKVMPVYSQLLSRLESSGIKSFQDFQNELFNREEELRKLTNRTENEEIEFQLLQKTAIIQDIFNNIIYLSDKFKNTNFPQDLKRSENPFKFLRTFNYDTYAKQAHDQSTIAWENATTDDNPITVKTTSTNTPNTIENTKKVVTEILKKMPEDFAYVEGTLTTDTNDKLPVFMISQTVIEEDDVFGDGETGVAVPQPLIDICLFKEGFLFRKGRDKKAAWEEKPSIGIPEEFKGILEELYKAQSDLQAGQQSQDATTETESIVSNSITYQYDKSLTTLIDALNTGKDLTALVNTNSALSAMLLACMEQVGLTPMSDINPTDDQLNRLGIYKDNNGKYYFKVPDKLEPAFIAKSPLIFNVGDEVSVYFKNELYKLKVTEVNNNGKIKSAVAIDGKNSRYSSGRFQLGKTIRSASSEYASETVKFSNEPISWFEYAAIDKEKNTTVFYRNQQELNLHDIEKTKEHVAVYKDIQRILSLPYSNTSTACAYTAVIDKNIQKDDEIIFKLVAADSNITEEQLKSFYGGKEYSFIKKKSYVGIYKGNDLIGIVDPSNQELLQEISDKKSNESIKGKVSKISTKRANVLTKEKHNLSDFKSDNYLVVYSPTNNESGKYYTNKGTEVSLEDLNKEMCGTVSEDFLKENQGKFIIFPRTVMDDGSGIMVSKYAAYGTPLIYHSFEEVVNGKSEEELKTLFFLSDLSHFSELLSDEKNLTSNNIDDFNRYLANYFYSKEGHLKLYYTSITNSEGDEEIQIHGYRFQNHQNEDVQVVEGARNVTIDKVFSANVFNDVIELLKLINPLIGFNSNTNPFTSDGYFNQMSKLNGFDTTLALSAEHNVFFTYDDGIDRSAKSTDSKTTTTSQQSSTQYEVGYNENDNHTKRYWNVKEFDKAKIDSEYLPKIREYIKSDDGKKLFKSGIVKQDKNGTKYIQLTIIDIKDTSNRSTIIIGNNGKIYTSTWGTLESVQPLATQKSLSPQSNPNTANNNGSTNGTNSDSSTNSEVEMLRQQVNTLNTMVLTLCNIFGKAPVSNPQISAEAQTQTQALIQSIQSPQEQPQKQAPSQSQTAEPNNNNTAYDIIKETLNDEDLSDDELEQIYGEASMWDDVMDCHTLSKSGITDEVFADLKSKLFPSQDVGENINKACNELK